MECLHLVVLYSASILQEHNTARLVVEHVDRDLRVGRGRARTLEAAAGVASCADVRACGDAGAGASPPAGRAVDQRSSSGLETRGICCLIHAVTYLLDLKNKRP